MTDYDIAIIGGGIQGVGCAQATAAAGYSVCILEKDTWGAATSSRSTKLIHGGLRYLETFQFSLVRKALRERRTLLEIGGSLVQPAPFFIPVYDDSRRRPWRISVGLTLYRLLGGLAEMCRFEKIPQKDWPQFSGLRNQGLEKVYQYWDARTDDQALTRAVAHSAATLGAVLHEHAMFIDARKNENQGSYTVSYRENNQTEKLTCRALINAGGPWAGQIQTNIEGAPEPPPIELVQGTHIVLAGSITNHCLYVESPKDHRPVFILPWQGNTLAGATETAFSGDPAECRPTTREIEYLLNAVFHYFPSCKPELVGSFAGLRVLPHSRKDFNDRSRDTMIRYDAKDNPRLASLYGGKLTTYRATSEEVIKRLARTLGNRDRKLDTAKIYLDTETIEKTNSPGPAGS